MAHLLQIVKNVILILSNLEIFVFLKEFVVLCLFDENIKNDFLEKFIKAASHLKQF